LVWRRSAGVGRQILHFASVISMAKDLNVQLHACPGAAKTAPEGA
jgi:hypothetical protein